MTEDRNLSMNVQQFIANWGQPACMAGPAFTLNELQGAMADAEILKRLLALNLARSEDDR